MLTLETNSCLLELHVSPDEELSQILQANQKQTNQKTLHEQPIMQCVAVVFQSLSHV